MREPKLRYHAKIQNYNHRMRVVRVDLRSGSVQMRRCRLNLQKHTGQNQTQILT